MSGAPKIRHNRRGVVGGVDGADVHPSALLSDAAAHASSVLTEAEMMQRRQFISWATENEVDESIDREHRFHHGQIETPPQRCTFQDCAIHTTDGQYCPQHLSEREGLRIGPQMLLLRGRMTNAGRGLFATRSFAVGQHICFYTGDIIRPSQKISTLYAYHLNSEEILDSARKNTAPGRMVNSVTNQQQENCRFVSRGSKHPVRIEATKLIRAGDAIVLMYGKDFTLIGEAASAAASSGSNAVNELPELIVVNAASGHHRSNKRRRRQSSSHQEDDEQAENQLEYDGQDELECPGSPALSDCPDEGDSFGPDIQLRGTRLQMSTTALADLPAERCRLLAESNFVVIPRGIPKAHQILPGRYCHGKIHTPSQRCSVMENEFRCVHRTNRGHYCKHHRDSLLGLQIKESPGKGKGLFATKRFVVGSKLDYTGDLHKTARLGKDHKSTYLLDLDNGWTIDAARLNAGYGRWVNHSSNPEEINCELMANKGENKGFVKVIRPIAVGDEFLCSYGDNYWSVRHSTSSVAEIIVLDDDEDDDVAVMEETAASFRRRRNEIEERSRARAAASSAPPPLVVASDSPPAAVSTADPIIIDSDVEQRFLADQAAITADIARDNEMRERVAAQEARRNEQEAGFWRVGQPQRRQYARHVRNSQNIPAGDSALARRSAALAIARSAISHHVAIPPLVAPIVLEVLLAAMNETNRLAQESEELGALRGGLDAVLMDTDTDEEESKQQGNALQGNASAPPQLPFPELSSPIASSDVLLSHDFPEFPLHDFPDDASASSSSYVPSNENLPPNDFADVWDEFATQIESTTSLPPPRPREVIAIDEEESDDDQPPPLVPIVKPVYHVRRVARQSRNPPPLIRIQRPSSSASASASVIDLTADDDDSNQMNTSGKPGMRNRFALR